MRRSKHGASPNKLRPHGEERCAAPRLEPWPRAPSVRPSFETPRYARLLRMRYGAAFRHMGSPHLPPVLERDVARDVVLQFLAGKAPAGRRPYELVPIGAAHHRDQAGLTLAHDQVVRHRA